MLVRRRVEAELAPAADDLGFGMVTWSPLRSGLLSGKYNDGMPEDARLSMEKYEWLHGILTEDSLTTTQQLQEIADELEVSMAQLAIGWLLRLPQVTSVITGATKLNHLKDNLKALEVVDKLSPNVLERIESVLGNAPQPED
jgi:aryl-alcohol dehydrogenase-like predicted oxidoreductase